MNAYLNTLQEWFRGLAPRERAIVSAGTVIVAITLLYLLVWEPLSKAQSRYAQELVSAHALAQKLEILAANARNAQGSGGSVGVGTSLLSAVDQASKSGTLTKPLSRIQPEGDTEVKVWIDGTSFDSLLRWIGELESRYGIRAQAVDIEKDATPGQVNAHLSLVRT